MSDKQIIKLVFPWSITIGLAKALSNAELWAFVISASTLGNDYKDERQNVKRIIKKHASTLPSVISVISIENDENFGHALSTLMEIPNGRSELYTHLDECLDIHSPMSGRAWIANKIYRFATRVGTAPSKFWQQAFPEITETREGELSYLHLEKFRSWFHATSLEDQVRCQAIAIASCGFAILQPELAKDIYEVLASSPDEFSAWINPERRQTTRGRKRKKQTKARNEHVPIQTKTPTTESTELKTLPTPVLAESTTGAVAKQFNADSPGHLSKQIKGWGDAAQFGVTLTEIQHQTAIKEIKQAASRLVLITQELDSQRSQLELMKKRIGKNAAELANLPWFSSPFEYISTETSEVTTPLSKIMETLRKDYTLFTQLLDIHSRLGDLYQTIGKDVQPLTSIHPLTLETVCEVLAEEANNTEALIKRTADQERRVANILDSLTDSPLVEKRSILADMSEGLCEDILLFLAMQRTVSESGKRHASVKGNLELAGIVLGLLREKRADWLKCVKESRVTHLVSGSEDFERLFRFVDIGGMREICLEFPALAPHFCTLAAGIAIHESKPPALEYTADFLDETYLTQRSKQVLSSLLDFFRRGEFGKVLTVARLRSTDKNASTKKLSNEQKLRLKEMVTNPPGLHKTYHLLRVIAQTEYLKPLESFIDENNFAAAIKMWEGFGGLDEMVQKTIRISPKENEVETRHRKQTRSFLEAFDEALREWSSLQQTVPAAESQRLESQFSALDSDNTEDRELLSIICGNTLDASNPHPHLRILGDQLFSSRHDDTMCLSNAEGLVSVQHQLCWPLMVTGQVVPFLTYTADFLSGLLVGFKSLSELVERYLSNSEFKAAQEAAVNDAELTRRVDTIVESKRRELSEQHSELLQEASTAIEDEFVHLLLTETKESIKNLAIEEFEKNIEELKQALAEYRSKQDPGYMQLQAFLEEYDVDVAPGRSRSELESEVTKIKQSEASRRDHLSQLLSLAEKYRIAESTKDRIRKLVTELDLPSRWPTKDNSEILGAAIGKLDKYIANRLSYRDGDHVAESVARAIVVEVKACASAPTEAIEDMVFRFDEKADKITSPGIPEDAVMQLIEEHAATTASWADGRVGLPTNESIPDLIRLTPADVERDLAKRREEFETKMASGARSKNTETFSRTEELVAKVRSFFGPLIQKSTTTSKTSVSGMDLSRAISSERWSEAMQLAASLITDDLDSADSECLSSEEVAFVVSKTMQDLRQHPEDCSPVALRLACLAIACSDPTSYSHLLASERISQVVCKVFYRIVFGDSKPVPSNQDSLDSLTRTISHLASATDGNKAFRWVNDLFIDASDAKCGELDGGSILANSLWEWATNKGKNVHEPRSELLLLLYRLRRLRAIDSLIRHAATPRRAEIRLCLQTISKISSDPELRRNAHTKFHAIQERATGQPNTKPWLTFFGKILAQDQREGENLKCVVESDQVAFDENDDGLIEVELTPDAVDPPSELHLTLTTIQEKDRKSVKIQLPLDTEPLLKSKLFTISIPSEFLQSAGEVLRISAHFAGLTALGRAVDLRESWNLPFSSEKLQPIDGYQQSQNWPGATGDPVRKEGGFYGREREFKELCSYINDNQRPRSVMVFGQRDYPPVFAPS